jgi:hypothetical protein
VVFLEQSFADTSDFASMVGAGCVEAVLFVVSIAPLFASLCISCFKVALSGFDGELS